jgi:putative ABC transport system permease protein
MKIVRTILSRFQFLFQRREVKQEIDDELQFHVEQRTAENVAAGMTPEEAAREARKRFGNFQRVREECREARGANIGESFFQDVRFAARVLVKNAGFAFIAIATLALGVAGNMVIFTIYNALYLRPFPFVEPDRLVDLDETAPRWNLDYTAVAFPDFVGWQEHNRAFESIAAYKSVDRVLSLEDGSEWARGISVTASIFTVLKIQPTLGRGFSSEEDQPGGPKVVMLANAFWKRRFGGREDVIGQTIRINRQAHTIVGVLPADKNAFLEGDYWTPLAYGKGDGGSWHLSAIGRLKPGITIAMAGEDLRRVHQGLIDDRISHPATSPKLTLLADRFFGTARPIIRALLGTVVVVLLIACGNVAALMLARGLARARELGLRISLGATRWRVARLIGVESFLLAGMGAALGSVLGWWGLRVLIRSLPTETPHWVSFEMDWRVWLFAAGMVAVSALLGALPVIRSATKLDLRAVIQTSGQQSTSVGAARRSLHALVVAEMALTLVVMVQAGLLIQTFRQLQTVDPGYRADHVLIYEVDLGTATTGYPSVESRLNFFQQHLEHVRALPGVTAVGAVTAPPLGSHWGNFFRIENAPPKNPNDPDPVVLQRIAMPGYFEAMGIPLVSGRTFTDQDGANAGSQVIIVDETFAKMFWPGQDPIGKRVRQNPDAAPWMTVIGVSKDVRHYGVDQPMRPGVYMPYLEVPQTRMAIVIRSTVPPSTLVSAVRAEIRRVDPELPMFGVVTMEDRMHESMWARRLTASLFALFAGVALAMAIGGVYGVFSYMVNRRTQEIGVRLALGAQRREILWLVVRHGMILSGIGIGIGIVGTLIVTPVTKTLLYGISPFEPLTFLLMSLALLAVAVVACWMPARRAMNVELREALRCE